MARIVVAGFLHETNTFASPTAYRDFASRPSGLGFMRGPALEPFATIPRGTGGLVTAALDAGHEVVPLMWCSAEPGGIVTSDAFERVMAELLDRLAAALPCDALYLDIHGAMVSEHYDDGEAEILRRVRAIVGDALPLATSLDLHGNIGAGMVAHADAMVSYRTYPHIDMRETGARAFTLIERLLAKGNRAGGKLAKARRALPFLMPIHRQSTLTEPCRAIYAELARIEASDPRIASLSLLPGFPMADVPMCGPVVLAYADDQRLADDAADRLTAFIAAREGEFAPHLKTPEEAIAAAAVAPAGKPVIFADVQDNSGAGGTSDTTGILEALVRAKVPDAIVAIVYDAESAAAAHAAGEGATVTLDLGGRLVAGQRPYRATFTVEKLREGKFPLTGPMGKGLNADLGKVALLAIGGVRVVVSSKRTQCLDQAYFRCVGLEPAGHRIVVVKSSNHYRADFQPIAGAIFDVAAPAVYDVNPANLAWRKLPRGLRLYGGGPAVA